MLKIFFLLILITAPAQSETIIIKSPSAKKKSKAILDKNFLFMKTGNEEAFTRGHSVPNSQAQHNPESKSSSNLSHINSSLNQTQKKHTNIRKQVTAPKPESKSMNPNSSSTAQTKTQVNIYDEDNWQEYTDYEEIEMEESLGVKAIIR